MEKIYRYDRNANVNLPICIVYNQEISFGTNGTISLRKESKTGDVIESFDIHSHKLLLNITEIILYPSKPLPYETTVYVTVTEGSVVSTINKSTFYGLEEDGNEEFYFVTEEALGKSLEGGTVIHKDEGGYYLIAAPQNTEINGSWNEIDNIITRVSENTNTNGWYLPSIYEMQNLIYANKNYWMNNENSLYWARTEIDSSNAYIFNMNTAIAQSTNKKDFRKIRLFKKVLY
jgi:hypothetical protein